MQRYNSTIRNKIGECPMCSNGKKVPLIKGACHSHYWLGVKMKSADKMAEKEDNCDDEDVATLKKDLDLIFSRWLRYSAVEEDGLCTCFICGWRDYAQNMDAGHYIKRGNSFLRFDTRNVTVNCKTCNQYKKGNLIAYSKKLEEKSPGITEILLEESNIVYKFSRDELKQLISEYSQKLLALKK